MKISVCVNKSSNGNFSGEISSIVIDSGHNYAIATIITLNIIKCKYDYDKKIIIIDEFELPFIYTKTSPATWCYDELIIRKKDLAKLLNYIRKSKLWIVDDSISEFDEIWERKKPILATDLAKLEELNV